MNFREFLLSFESATFFLLAIFALSGCYGKEFRVDKDFTWDERLIIEEAAMEWYEATDSEHACITLNFGHSRPEKVTKAMVDDEDVEVPFIYRIHREDSVYDEVRDFYDSEFNGYRASAGILLLPKQIHSGDEFKETILHELGHEFGLSHERGGELMDKDSFTPCIDQVALNEFCRIWSCGPASAATCQNGTKIKE